VVAFPRDVHQADPLFRRPERLQEEVHVTVTALDKTASSMVAVGGGGRSPDGKKMDQDYPALAADGKSPIGWTVLFDGEHGSNTTYVVCTN
jgi:ketosteroid isomerase-like protein